jgi:predicted Zn-dependent protease with MMP-like domain
MITTESIEKIVNDMIARSPEEVVLTARRIVLNIDEEYLEHILKRMDSNQIELFIEHLKRARLVAEKELLDRS